MKIDTTIASDIASAPATGRAAEAEGYDGLWTAETSHDPFFPLVAAAGSTERVNLGTSIAVAFARNPMLLANIGHDLAAASEGRFILGLGSQIRPHIQKRFSMEWSKPAARMREMVQAIRAIWDCWDNGGKLDFRGEFYTHVLMTPFFNPGPNRFGPPPIYLAGVGPLMTEVAGEVCDGFFVHPFSTPDYLTDVTLPALERGRQKSGRSAEGFEVMMPAFVVTGPTEEIREQVSNGIRGQIAFYGSTPGYKGVLDHHGIGELQPELNRLSKLGEWGEMAKLIDDDVLNIFAVVAEPDQVAAGVVERFGGIAQRVGFNTMMPMPDGFWGPIAAEIRSLTA